LARGEDGLSSLELLQEIDTRRLEEESNAAYRLVAAEYYDGRHMTCRAFDFLDEQILDVYRKKCGLVESRKQYLEVGAGIATLLRGVLPSDSTLVAGDFCAEMAQHALPLPPNITYRQFSAFNLPFPENHFDGVFAFLADSYNVPRFYSETWRVLKPGGFLFLTCPTKLWATTLRQGDCELLQYARFTTLEGRTVFIPSITRSKEEYHQVLARVGFTKLVYEEFCLPSDYPSNRLPDTIRVPAQRLRREVSRLPLVAALLGEKRGEYPCKSQS